MNPQTTKADFLDQLLKLDPNTALPGYTDGLQSAFAYTTEQWRDQALDIVCSLAADGERFTAEVLRRLGLPAPEKPQQWGALFAALQHHGIAEAVGWGPSTTASGQERGVRIWQGL
ncbi:hypothetical protein [Glutamicibacter arilaitensis]|uniref:hypothetical protein n=1 Tax=Glutamicibacter arilaitensis TaxID=256701 RepID=UPI0038517F41